MKGPHPPKAVVESLQVAGQSPRPKPVQARASTIDAYGEDFHDYWALRTAAPPEGVNFDEWIQLRQLHGLAQQVANIASTHKAQRNWLAAPV